MEKLLHILPEAAQAVYKERLISLAVYGSVGRGTAGPSSDLDLFLVAEPLPAGRLARMQEFDAIENILKKKFAQSLPHISVILKTRTEADYGTPLYLDMTQDARILIDRNGFLANRLEALRLRLEARGAVRHWLGSAWYWDLAPDGDYKRTVEL